MPNFSLYSDYEGSRLELLILLVEQGEEPAFLRRSRCLAETLAQLHTQLRIDRNRLLKHARSILDILALQVQNDWSSIGAYLARQGDFRIYEHLFNEWKSELSASIETNTAGWQWSRHRSIVKFHGAIDRFNSSWRGHLDRFDLALINRKLSDYNTYYPMEKACAFGREDIELLGFIPTRPMTLVQLEVAYPLIELPRLGNK